MGWPSKEDRAYFNVRGIYTIKDYNAWLRTKKCKCEDFFTQEFNKSKWKLKSDGNNRSN